MSNITDEEANKLLDRLVKLRELCKKSKSKGLHMQYKKQINLCAEKFDYMVKNKVRKYKAFPNYDDLLQDGRLALVLAFNSYELNKGSWFWWANQYIKTKISREANRHSTIKIPIKKTKDILPYKISQIPVIVDSSQTALESIESSEIHRAINNEVLKLPQMHRRVVQMYYEMDNFKHKKSISKICKELCISNKEFKKTLEEAQFSLRKNLVNMSF